MAGITPEKNLPYQTDDTGREKSEIRKKSNNRDDIYLWRKFGLTYELRKKGIIKRNKTENRSIHDSTQASQTHRVLFPGM